jgi:hypothetical protein
MAKAMMDYPLRYNISDAFYEKLATLMGVGNFVACRYPTIDCKVEPIPESSDTRFLV